MEDSLLWAEIDLNAISHNICELRRIANPKAMLMAAVKANAYGHGAFRIASHAVKSGADRLGVANINEAISLRSAGIKAPILIFGYTPRQSVHLLAELDLTQAVHSFNTAQSLSSAALSLGKSIRIHLKVDTGMGRLGILQINDNELPALKEECKKTVKEALSTSRLKGIELEGIFTHFATADFFDKSYANVQFCRFMDFIDAIKKAGFTPPVLHAANSAALIDMPETHLDMVRPGISIYGLYPSDEIDKSRVDLKPAMTLKTKIIHLKDVPAGFKISYGITYETKKPTTIATVPIGYADGFNRLLSSRGFMLVNGRRAPVVGRVCMDLTMLDVGHIPDVGLEDEVVVIGRQKEECISADEIAAATNTINYEVVTSIGSRAKRVYKLSDKVKN